MFKRDFFAGIFLTVLFTVTGIMALKFPTMAKELPLGLSAVGAILSVSLSIRALIRHKKGNDNEDEVVHYSSKGKKNILIGFALLVAYAVLISYIGFTVSTFLYLVTSMAILFPGKLAKKNWIVIIIISAAFCAMLYVVFKVLLYVPLPKGWLV